MRVWRGEEIDWGRLEEEHTPKNIAQAVIDSNPNTSTIYVNGTKTKKEAIAKHV